MGKCFSKYHHNVITTHPNNPSNDTSNNISNNSSNEMRETKEPKIKSLYNFPEIDNLDEKYINKLKEAKRENFIDFSFENETRVGKVVSVYDGDTVRVVFYQNHPPKENETPIMCSVRLSGIDTPEIKTKNEKEKQAGYKARNRLIELINYELVNIQFGKNDKYGRPLVTLFNMKEKNLIFARSINNRLVLEGHAYTYFGKTKKQFNSN